MKQDTELSQDQRMKLARDSIESMLREIVLALTEQEPNISISVTTNTTPLLLCALECPQHVQRVVGAKGRTLEAITRLVNAVARTHGVNVRFILQS